MLLILEYSFPHRYISTPFKFVNNMRTTAEVKLFDFQDPRHKSDFSTYSGRAIFQLLKSLVGNQYL